MLKFKKYMSVAMIGCMVLLSACGEKKMDFSDVEDDAQYEKIDEANVSKNEGDDEQENPLEKKLGVIREWKDEIAIGQGAGAQSKITVDVNVSVPNINKMYVAKASRKQFSKAEKRNIAESLFEPNTIRANFNGGFESKEEIEKMIDAVNDEIEFYKNEVDLNHYTNGDWNAVYATQMLEGLSIYKNQYDDLYKNYKGSDEEDPDDVKQWTESIRQVPDYLADDFIGEMNGQTYYLKFRNGKIEFGRNLQPVYGMNGLTEGVDMGLLSGAFGENLCELQEEEAIRQAKNWCEQRGFVDFDVVETSPLNWRTVESGEEKDTSNGYVVTLSRKLKGVQTPVEAYDNAALTTKEQSDSYNDLDIAKNTVLGMEYYDRDYYQDDFESIVIGINDEGIVAVTCTSLLDIKENEIAETELLQYEQVKELLRKEIRTRYEASVNFTPSIRYQTLELRYVRIADGSDFYIVPAWCMYTKKGGYQQDNRWKRIAERAQNMIIVNAIDGSAIELNELVHAEALGL